MVLGFRFLRRGTRAPPDPAKAARLNPRLEKHLQTRESSERERSKFVRFTDRDRRSFVESVGDRAQNRYHRYGRVRKREQRKTAIGTQSIEQKKRSARNVFATRSRAAWKL